MYGERHLLAYRSKEEAKFAFKLSGRQFAWYAGGAVVSEKLATFLPPIPHIWMFGYLPYWLPFCVAVTFAHLDHYRTGLRLNQYLMSYIKCKRRKRVFTR